MCARVCASTARELGDEWPVNVEECQRDIFECQARGKRA